MSLGFSNEIFSFSRGSVAFMEPSLGKGVIGVTGSV